MSKTVTVDVEVDLSDFDDEDLIDEPEERGYFVSGSGHRPALDAVRVYEMMRAKAPGHEEAIAEFVAECAGRIA